MTLTSKIRLNTLDHQLLLLLIQGKTIHEASLAMNVTNTAVTARLAHMRQCTRCKTTYELIAIEVINLLYQSEPNEVLLADVSADKSVAVAKAANA